jgi:SAM-dependent methyltransferase
MTGDLMYTDQIRSVVRETYGRIPHGAGEVVAKRLYTPDELAEVPARCVEWALGVGNPVRHARIVPGETVVDLGCGGGIDTVLAARRTGPTGRVAGVDMLPEMCERTREAAAEAGVTAWCTAELGEMEALPLPDGVADVVISNGVVNLSPRKSRALAEAFRVLRPGGRLCVADLTVEDDLPPEVLSSGAAWAGCIAGALSEAVLARKLDNVGFTDVTLSERIAFSLDDVLLYPLFTDDVVDLMRRLLSPTAQEKVAVSLVAHAVKPPDHVHDGTAPG